MGMIAVWGALCLFLVTVSGVPAARLPIAEPEEDRAERKSAGKDTDPPPCPFTHGFANIHMFVRPGSKKKKKRFFTFNF